MEYEKKTMRNSEKSQARKLSPQEIALLVRADLAILQRRLDAINIEAEAIRLRMAEKTKLLKEAENGMV